MFHEYVSSDSKIQHSIPAMIIVGLQNQASIDRSAISTA